MSSEPGSIFDVRSIASEHRREAEESIRRRCQVAYLGENEALCRVLGRYKMLVDTRDIGFASHVMLDGYWEMWLTELVVREILPGMHVVDIGANFGYYTLLMSDLIGPQGRCHAFEPNPLAAGKLFSSVSLNGFSQRTKVHKCALAAAEGKARFAVPLREPKNAHIVPAGAQPDPAQEESIEVPVASLDSLAAELGPIDFIKIDAEGAEYDILIGMQQTMSDQHPRIVLEFNAGRAYESRTLLQLTRRFYPRTRFLDFDGQVKDVSENTLLTENVGQDWLLYFAS